MFAASFDAKRGRQSAALFDLKGKRACWAIECFKTLGVSTNDHKSTVMVDLGITNKFQQVGTFTNMESMHNEVIVPIK